MLELAKDGADIPPVQQPVRDAPTTRLAPVGLGLDDKLDFRCDPTWDCFTHCCRDVSIVLTPYDVLRLKRALRIDSTAFLEKYTVLSCTRNRKLPLVLLKMNDGDKRCPFVAEDGCSIYVHRPWACRMYPLGLAQSGNPAAAERGGHFIIREDFCHGHGKGSRTVRQWLSDQEIESFEMMGGSFERLMLSDFWTRKEPLSGEEIEMFLMACFDLDRFRRFVLETRFLELFDVHDDRVEALRSEDEELLELGIDWLQFSLCHERTLRLKKDAALGVRQRSGRLGPDGLKPEPSQAAVRGTSSLKNSSGAAEERV